MKVIQGDYAGKIESGKGKLKGLRIATEQGDELVYLPKSLRAIAQAELTLKEPVRVWIERDRSSKKKRYVLQLVPLTPKFAVSASVVPAEITTDTGVTSDGAIAQPNEAKPTEAKPTEAKPTEAKPTEAKPTEVKSTEAKVDQTLDKQLDKQKAKKKGHRKASKQKKKRTSEVTVQICQKKNCCKKGGDDLWAAFEAANAEHQFKLEPIGCLGGCKRGPNIRLLPDNVKYRHVQLAEVDDILQTHRA